MGLKTVTYEEFLKFDPCWLDTEEGSEKLKCIASMKRYWTALDVLELDHVHAHDRLWAVLREEFIPVKSLHEFACWCADCALGIIGEKDSSLTEAIEKKRKWINGEITNNELKVIGNRPKFVNESNRISNRIEYPNAASLFVAGIKNNILRIDDAGITARRASYYEARAEAYTGSIKTVFNSYLFEDAMKMQCDHLRFEMLLLALE